MSNNPFLTAQTLLGQALQLLEASDLPPAAIVEAVDELCILRLIFDVRAKRPQPTINEFEWRLVSDDFEQLAGQLAGDKCAPIRALVSQARSIIATEAAQPAGSDAAEVDVYVEGVR